MRWPWSRRREGLPEGWREIVVGGLAHWGLLDDAERDLLADRADALLRDKRWEAARGFELTDEVRVVIAAQAALMVLEADPGVFRLVDTVLVHPRPMRTHRPVTGPAPGLLTERPGPVGGHTFTHGPVVIAWSQARANARRPEAGRNVVIHEFAHKIDLLDATLDGTPPLAAEERQRWEAVVAAELDAVREGTSALRSYAGHNPGELFAVASETFFCRPVEMEAESPELYDLLGGFYRQDPAERVRRSTTAD